MIVQMPRTRQPIHRIFLPDSSSRIYWATRCATWGAGLVGMTLFGCIDVALPEINVPFEVTAFGGASTFVITGTASVADQNGPCPVWLGDNGVTYHLFQSPSLANDVFDRIVSVGTTARLVLAVRSDLELTCAFGRTAEVVDVLEIQE